MASSGGAGIGPPPVPKGITIGRGTNWYKAAQAAQNPPVPPAPYSGPKGITIGQGTNWYNRTQQVQNKYQGAPGSAPPPPKATPQQNQGAASQTLNPSPLDATALGNEATNLFNVNNRVNALTQQATQNDVALQSSLGQLAEQQPIDQLKQMYAANRAGGLYGSVEAGDQGLLARGFQEKQSALQTNAGNLDAKIANQIGALLGGIPLYNNQQANASALRLAQLAANNPAQAPLAGGSSGSASGGNTGSHAGGNTPGSKNKGNGLVNYNKFGVPKGAKPPGPNPILKGPGQAPKRGNGLVNYNKFGVPKGAKGSSGGSGY